MARKEIFLEDAVLDDLSGDLEIVERPLSGGVFLFLGWLGVVFILVVFLRVAYADVVRGEFYFGRALLNAGQRTILKAPRGAIMDRFQSLLVENESSFSLSLNLAEFFKEMEKREEILERIHDIVVFNKEVAREGLSRVDLERQSLFSLVPRLSLPQVIALRRLNERAVVVESGFSRRYRDDLHAAHTIGYVGFVDQSDLLSQPGLSFNDETGKTGLEKMYDSFLRGKNGVALHFQDARGNLLEIKTVSRPVAGNSVITTLDAEFQEYFSKELQAQLKNLDRRAGVGIALDHFTGEILAMVSFPDFSANNLTSDIFIDPEKSLFHRAVSGLYSPGSAIKPVVAFAALEEGLVKPSDSVFSAGFIEIPNPYNPSSPSRFVDWKPHGWVDLYSALARSSNVYFYAVGGGYENIRGLGIERLKSYWQKFLFDKKTGIDLPQESVGTLPDPEVKESRSGVPWRLGDTYNVSIGQGDLLMSPLSLLRSVAIIANRGKAPVPFLVSEIKDGDGKTVFSQNPAFVDVPARDGAHFEEVEKGMIDAVDKEYGTARLLSSVPMVIAGKTGSAQFQNNMKVNAFFVGYSIPRPKESPVAPQQIAVLVLIEDAREGSLNAVPVAEKIFQWYYNNRIRNAKF